MNAKEDYEEKIDAAVDYVQTAILSDEEATTVVMERALPLSHRFDLDQQRVADDINAAFKYKFGMDPSDYADSVRSPDI